MPAPLARLSSPPQDETWLCSWCLNHVADEMDRFTISGADELTFVNPAGKRFKIITFKRAPGCAQRGAPTFKQTWFPGFAWTYSVCRRCGTQLGWKYLGQGEFYGLIKDRLVRGSLVWN